MTERASGFTLIELMIVVTIIGILAAITLPAYDGYIRRGNRTVAKTVLAEIASRQENFFTDRKTYASNLGQDAGELGYFTADTFYIGRNGVPVASASGAIYSIAMPVAGTVTSFSVTATAVGAQAKDAQCVTLSINNAGSKTSTGGGTDCWTR